MKFRNESEIRLRKELMRITHEASSLGILEWLLHIIPRDLTNTLYIQSNPHYKNDFHKLGGMSWYFKAAFDETYEADGYDVNTDKTIPVLDTIITNSDEWVPSSEFSEHSKSTTPINPTHQRNLPQTPTSELDQILDSYELHSGPNITLIHESVREEIEYSETLDRFIIFFGLPSRKIKTEIHYNPEHEYYSTGFNDQEIESLYTIWPSQLLKNMIGGWDSSSVISTEKQILQWFSLLVKIPIILPIKILTLIPKITLNCIKLFTEFFPLVAKRFSAHAFAWAFLKFLNFKYHTFKRSSKSSKETAWLYYLVKFLIVIGILFALFSYYAFRSTAIIGRAITSPEKSMRMAFRYGRMLQILILGEPTSFFISLLVGTIGLCLSLSITIIAWSIIFPIIFGALSVYSIDIARFMLVVVAKLTSILNSFALGHTLIVLVQSTYATLAPLLFAAFGSVISNVATYVFGVKLATSFIIKFSFIGAVSAVIAPALSRVADELSNLWVSWKGAGLFTYLVESIKQGIDTLMLDDKPSSKHSPTSVEKEQQNTKDSQDKSSMPSDFVAPSVNVVDFTQSHRSALMSSEEDSTALKRLEELARKGQGDDSSDSSSQPPRLYSQDPIVGGAKNSTTVLKIK